MIECVDYSGLSRVESLSERSTNKIELPTIHQSFFSMRILSYLQDESSSPLLKTALVAGVAAAVAGVPLTFLHFSLLKRNLERAVNDAFQLLELQARTREKESTPTLIDAVVTSKEKEDTSTAPQVSNEILVELEHMKNRIAAQEEEIRRLKRSNATMTGLVFSAAGNNSLVIQYSFDFRQRCEVYFSDCYIHLLQHSTVLFHLSSPVDPNPGDPQQSQPKVDDSIKCIEIQHQSHCQAAAQFLLRFEQLIVQVHFAIDENISQIIDILAASDHPNCSITYEDPPPIDPIAG